jgi:hypothetical protein
MDRAESRATASTLTAAWPPSPAQARQPEARAGGRKGGASFGPHLNLCTGGPSGGVQDGPSPPTPTLLAPPPSLPLFSLHLAACLGKKEKEKEKKRRGNRGETKSCGLAAGERCGGCPSSRPLPLVQWWASPWRQVVDVSSHPLTTWGAQLSQTAQR